MVRIAVPLAAWLMMIRIAVPLPPHSYRYGLVIGSTMAYPVRFLMIITSPISWPISKLLDHVLGGEHASLFR